MVIGSRGEREPIPEVALGQGTVGSRCSRASRSVAADPGEPGQRGSHAVSFETEALQAGGQGTRSAAIASSIPTYYADLSLSYLDTKVT